MDKLKLDLSHCCKQNKNSN